MAKILSRSVARWLAILALTSAALATAGTAAASQRTPARAPADVRFVQFATSANRVGNSTYINNAATNGKPHVLLFVTPNWNPRNTLTGKFINHPIGVWYDPSVNRWAIFCEDGMTMPLGRAFNVLVVPEPVRTAFQVTSSDVNSIGDSLIMNHMLLNHHPGLLLQVTQILNRPGRTFMRNPHNIGVAYSSPHWVIVQEDGTAMTLGASFNVLVGSAGSGGVQMLLKTTSSNMAGNSVLFSNSNTNNRAGALVFATPDVNPGGGEGGVSDNAPIGVLFDKQVNPHKWGVFNQDKSAMPLKAAFNLLIFSTR